MHHFGPQSSILFRKWDDARGFTLMEVMLAMTLLAIVLPVLLGLRNRDLDLRERAREITTATFLAQEKLLETELLPVLPTGEQSGDFKDAAPGLSFRGTSEDRAPGYRWKRSIMPTPLEKIQEVRIEVLWNHGLNEESVELSHYVFQTSGGST
ncbi:MAG: prepilin-type N-terminal cleavage/methylation domain-containing protein [Nitrospiraceae bacterium]